MLFTYSSRILLQCPDLRLNFSSTTKYAYPYNGLYIRLTSPIKYVDAKCDKRLSVHNPVDGSLVSDNVHVAGEKDVDLAVDAAQAAFAGPWRKYTAAQRTECLLKLADLIDAKTKDLAELETIAMGQPIRIAVNITKIMTSIFRCKYFLLLLQFATLLIKILVDYAGWTDKIRGEQLAPENGVYKIISHHPFGVVAGISAWNGSGM